MHCPLIGTVSEFKKNFETPILRGRDASASDAVQKKGNEKLQEVYVSSPVVFTLHLPPSAVGQHCEQVYHQENILNLIQIPSS